MNCGYCESELNKEDILKKYGPESNLYELGFCSNACKNTPKLTQNQIIPKLIKNYKHLTSDEINTLYKISDRFL